MGRLLFFSAKRLVSTLAWRSSSCSFRAIREHSSSKDSSNVTLSSILFKPSRSNKSIVLRVQAKEAERVASATLWKRSSNAPSISSGQQESPANQNSVLFNQLKGTGPRLPNFLSPTLKQHTTALKDQNAKILPSFFCRPYLGSTGRRDRSHCTGY